jgi:hypothetical protein
MSDIPTAREEVQAQSGDFVSSLAESWDLSLSLENINLEEITSGISDLKVARKLKSLQKALEAVTDNRDCKLVAREKIFTGCLQGNGQGHCEISKRH